MLRFFRHIRKSLMEQNKVRTYFFYAIGEILLVVVGILIALQVNNWNEGRKALNQEQEILSALHNEFSENLQELIFDIGRLDTTYHNLIVLMDLMAMEELPSGVNVDSLIALTLETPTWNPSSYVLNDLKNSGSISRLSRANLQSKLFAWERHFENVKEIVGSFSNSSDAMISFLREESSLRNIDAYQKSIVIQPSRLGFDNRELLKDLRFENYVDDKLITVHQARDQYLKTVAVIEDLLNSIDKK